MKAKLNWLDNHFEETGIIILLTLLSCAMMLQVIMRYCFNSALPWPEEFCRYCYVWMTYFSIGLTIRRRSYFRVLAAVELLPKRGTAFFEILAQVANLIFFGWGTSVSFGIVESVANSAQSSPAMQIPMFYVYLILPIGMAIATLRSIQMIYITCLEFKNAGKTSDSASKLIQEAK